MPELPEVETVLRGIKPKVVGQKVTKIVARQKKLRWEIPDEVLEAKGKIEALTRRGKYLLFRFKTGTLILHLGMSGSLRYLSRVGAPGKHDHVDICFANQHCLRLKDPRRFGAVLWEKVGGVTHPLLKNIGIEPLSKSFTGKLLGKLATKRKVAIKNFLMNSAIIAGIGNIYAAEALFEARIDPRRFAGELSLAEYERLAEAIKAVLKRAIKKGGTTLKDFESPEGKPGYFAIRLKVYGRSGRKCYRCKQVLKSFRLGQRSTVYCSTCQK